MADYYLMNGKVIHGAIKLFLINLAPISKDFKNLWKRISATACIILKDLKQ